MMRNPAPSNLQEVEVMAREIMKTGRAPITQFRVTTPEQAAQATLAMICLNWGRKATMMERIIGDTELAEPGPDVMFAVRDGDTTYVFTNYFDRLKATLHYMLIRRLKGH
jgi:hypothetical protein